MELQYGDIVLRQTLQEFLLSKKRALIYTAGLKHLESCRNSFRNLNILNIHIRNNPVCKKKSVTAQQINKYIHITQEITTTIINTGTI
jgi:hypothetical protein